jgi:hypothetical protein
MPHVSAYLKTLEQALLKGNATEHTHRRALAALIESLGEGVTATNEPKRIECGAPDFIVTRGDVPLGYVEAKDVGVSLDKIEKGEQLRRYLDSLENLLLTDYLEFRWYVRGVQVHSARLGTFDAPRERVRVETGGAEEVEKLIGDFLTEIIPTVSSPKELAERMARVARLIRDTILRALRTEDAGGSLHDQMKGFREVLLHDMDEEQFADMYAQTICYGLFAARVNHRGTDAFTRRNAAHELPRTNPESFSRSTSRACRSPPTPNSSARSAITARASSRSTCWKRTRRSRPTSPSWVRTRSSRCATPRPAKAKQPRVASGSTASSISRTSSGKSGTSTSAAIRSVRSGSRIVKVARSPSTTSHTTAAPSPPSPRPSASCQTSTPPSKLTAASLLSKLKSTMGRSRRPLASGGATLL